MKNDCPHNKVTIVVLEAFEMVERIGYKCTECNEIIKEEIR